MNVGRRKRKRQTEKQTLNYRENKWLLEGR